MALHSSGEFEPSIYHVNFAAITVPVMIRGVNVIEAPGIYAFLLSVFASCRDETVS